MKRARRHENGAIPFDDLQYALNPELILSLAFAQRHAGFIEGMGWSLPTRRRLEAMADKQRILSLLENAQVGVEPEEVDAVLSGGDFSSSRRSVLATIRKVVELCHAVRCAAMEGTPTSPNTAAVYIGLLQDQYASESRRIMKNDVGTVCIDVLSDLFQIYEWMDADELVSKEPILRAAFLYWSLSVLYREPRLRPAVLAVVDHELRGRANLSPLFVLGAGKAGKRLLCLSPVVHHSARCGDLTGLFSYFVSEFAQSLQACETALRVRLGEQDQVPWVVLKLPDELDREIFKVIELVGIARCRDLREQLADPPPIRTLQRRLQRLTQVGLIVKRGSRKDACYVVADHSYGSLRGGEAGQVEL